jgi:hypothetical protein
VVALGPVPTVENGQLRRAFRQWHPFVFPTSVYSVDVLLVHKPHQGQANLVLPNLLLVRRAKREKG